MELPQPPQDEELKNIIDKLAVFVARNGVEFESMTKQKQRDNPRFGFLFGGEFYNYYMYRVTSEQAILKHRAMREQQQQPGQMRGPHPGGPNFQGFGGGGGNGPRMPQQQPQGQNPFDISPQQQQQQMGNFDQNVFPRGPPVQQGGSRFDKRNFNEFDRSGNFQGGFGAQGAAPGQHFGDRQSGGFDQRGNNFDMRMSAGPGSVFGDERGMGAGNFQGPGPAFRNFDQRGPPGLDQRGPPGLDQRGPPGLDQRGPPGLDQRGPPGLDQRGPPGLDQRGPPGLDQRGPPGLDQRGPPGLDQRGPPGLDQRGPPGLDQRGPPGLDQRGPGLDPRGPPGLDQRGPPGFDQRGPPGGQGNFDRGPPGGGNFDRGPPPRDFDQRERGMGLGFDRGPPGTFEPRGLTPGRQQDFDQRVPPPVRQADFDQRGPPPGRQADFDQRTQGRQADFDQRVVPPAAFEAGNNNFEQKRSSRFDQPAFEKQQPPPRSGGFEPPRLQQPAAVAMPFQQEVIKPFEPKPGPSFAATPGPNILAAAAGAGAVVTPAPAINVEVLKKQKAALEEQIRQSELNLAGQQQLLLTQQQNQIEEAIRQVQATEIQQLSMDLNVDIGEFDKILQPIVESCTKDAISTGKAWIFTHTSTPRHYHLVTAFLLKKVLDPSVSFSQRLHVIYLVNDVLHHCMRKGAEDLQQVLESMVIPMFCFTKATEVGNEENLAKLDKLFGLWETKSNYVSPGAVEKLRNYNQTWIEYKNDLVTRHGLVVAQIASSIQQTFDSYQTQHKLFCQHVAQNIKTLEQQIQQGIIQDQIRLQQQQQQEQQRLQQQPPPLAVGNVAVPGPGPAGPPIVTGYPGQLGPNAPTGQLIAPPYVPPVNDMGMVDLSKPPPGFPTPPPDKDLIPAMPYYELPAGLMVPMVKLEVDNYKPLDPKAIRLPPPCPPTDRLLQAVEAFYAQPSHERPRDSEGWERLGLYEYFKAKNLARKQKEDDIREGRRDKSRSPTPVRRDSSPNGGRSPPRRRYLSKSPTFNRSTRTSSRRSRSRSPSTSGSSSRRNKRSRRSRSRSRSPPPRRSPSPPSFSSAGLGMDRKLDESNKGHQLLKKMGWSGMGLGLNEQGIEAPISGGEVRERKDQYKGVGVAVNDPFESYRKSKGQAFVERMRARAEERL